MTLPRRRFLSGAAAAVAAPWLASGARAADVERFSLGVASGQPRADGMVLWTRLTGGDMAPRETVRWELAADEAFTRIVARGDADPCGLEGESSAAKDEERCGRMRPAVRIRRRRRRTRGTHRAATS